MHLEGIWGDKASAPRHRRVAVRDAVALALSFFGLLRRAELCRLTQQDIQVKQAAEGGMLLICVRESKTDQAKVGAYVPVPLATTHLSWAVWWSRHQEGNASCPFLMPSATAEFSTPLTVNGVG